MKIGIVITFFQVDHNLKWRTEYLDIVLKNISDSPCIKYVC